MAVTANQIVKKTLARQIKGWPVYESTRLYENTLAFLNASGYAVGTTGSGANKFLGLVRAEADNSSGASGAIAVETDYDNVTAVLTGAGTYTVADVGKIAYATDNFTIVLAPAANCVRIGTVVGFVSATQLEVALEVVGFGFQAAALTAALTTLTHTAPGTPDYAIQNLTTSTPYGFVTADEGNTVLKLLAALQVNVAEINAVLKAAGLTKYS